MANRIFHICSRTAWVAAQRDGAYRGDTLDAAGFIHCATRAQVAPTADAFFGGQRGLVLLEIDPMQLSAELVYEEPAGVGQDFPHIYGALNLDAVVAVFDFLPGPDGTFVFPN